MNVYWDSKDKQEEKEIWCLNLVSSSVLSSFSLLNTLSPILLFLFLVYVFPKKDACFFFLNPPFLLFFSFSVHLRSSVGERIGMVEIFYGILGS